MKSMSNQKHLEMHEIAQTHINEKKSHEAIQKEFHGMNKCHA